MRFGLGVETLETYLQEKDRTEIRVESQEGPGGGSRFRDKVPDPRGIPTPPSSSIKATNRRKRLRNQSGTGDGCDESL